MGRYEKKQIYMTRKQWVRLEDLAEQSVTVAEHIRRAIDEYLNREEKRS